MERIQNLMMRFWIWLDHAREGGGAPANHDEAPRLQSTARPMEGMDGGTGERKNQKLFTLAVHTHKLEVAGTFTKQGIHGVFRSNAFLDLGH